MNIEELRQELVSVGDQIESLIRHFEAKTGCEICAIGLNRIDVTSVDAQVKKSIVNVDLRVEL
jgi:hypothetical protein